MAVYQKLSEIGWFYHAPEKPKSKGPMDIPVASQIPGLNNISDLPPEEPPKALFRDTDTKYIRLAKMGGRENLLTFKDFSQKNKDPVPYPRNDWFYLEDNRLETEQTEPENPWEFRLPEYMVHDEHKPFGDNYDYANDPEHLVYWKNVKKRLGGRSAVAPVKGDSHKITEIEPAVPAVRAQRAYPGNKDAEKSQWPALPALYDPNARPAMNKLLAYGYANEWQSTRDDWYYRLRLAQEDAKQADTAAVKAQPTSANKHTTGSQRATWNDMTGKSRGSASKTSKSNKNGENKPSKSSRYNKIGSKVDTHRALPTVDLAI